MTPDELRKMALEATKREYELIMSEMEKAAKSGSFSCDFSEISDGAIQQLREAGFNVQKQIRPSRNVFGTGIGYYYEVSYR